MCAGRSCGRGRDQHSGEFRKQFHPADAGIASQRRARIGLPREGSCPIKTLDAVAGQYLKGVRAPFLKIDTQGFEWHVLDGARETRPHIKGILVELSLVPLYEGQHQWREVIDRLEAEGFILWAFKPAFTDQISGRTFQVDGIFYRTP